MKEESLISSILKNSDKNYKSPEESVLMVAVKKVS